MVNEKLTSSLPMSYPLNCVGVPVLQCDGCRASSFQSNTTVLFEIKASAQMNPADVRPELCSPEKLPLRYPQPIDRCQNIIKIEASFELNSVRPRI